MTQYIIEALDYPDVLDKRMAAREAHLASIRALKETGQYVVAAAKLDKNDKMIGSTLILQFENDEALEYYLKNEPYIAQNVWEVVKTYKVRIAPI